MNSIPVGKSIALCFRGFELRPEEVELIGGATTSESGVRGEPPKRGKGSPLRKSFARFSIDIPSSCRLDEMIPALFLLLGGLQHIYVAKEQIKPEFIEVNLVLPIKYSDEQESGFLPPSTLAELGLLGATLSFEFL